MKKYKNNDNTLVTDTEIKKRISDLSDLDNATVDINKSKAIFIRENN
jgi:hypothetical protein